MPHRFILRILALPLAMILSGCRPLCTVAPTDANQTKTAWFGKDLELPGNDAWERKGSYTGSALYFEPVDFSSMEACKDCKELTEKLASMYKTEWNREFAAHVKSLRVVDRKEDAEFIGSIKIASVKEIRSFWKIPVGFISN